MKILIWKESSRYFRMVVLTEVARFSRLVNKMSRLEVRRVRRKRDRTNDQEWCSRWRYTERI
jgi:hypothetical protein